MPADGLPIHVLGGRNIRCMCSFLDLNGNGEIEPEEWVKACPCFEVGKEWSLKRREIDVGENTESN